MSTPDPIRCGFCNELVERGPRGRSRRYCNDAHRQAAHRQRTIAREVETPVPSSLEAFVPDDVISSDEYVVETFLEARRITGTLYRLGQEARPALAWRCATAASEINATLDRVLEGGD